MSSTASARTLAPNASQGMRVTLLTNCIPPYRVPLWNELGQICDLNVVVLNAVHPQRAWKVNPEALEVPVVSVDSPHIGGRTPQSSLPIATASVVRAVDRSRPEVVIITGWSIPGYWGVLLWSRWRKLPVVLWAESNALSSETESIKLLRWVKRSFVRRCDSFIVPGRLSAEYLTSLGAAPESIVVGRNTPDDAKFSDCVAINRSASPALLYVGDLVQRKGVPEMLSALQTIKDRDWTLSIVGAGPLLNDIRTWVDENGLNARVRLTGYVQQDMLSQEYRAADILLFPSLRDWHPLVVPEALLSGVYVLGSDETAASFDLIVPGVNGDIVSPADPASFGAAIGRTITRVPFNRQAIRSTFEKATPRSVAHEILHAAKMAVTARGQVSGAY